MICVRLLFQIRWHTVYWGFMLQFLLGVFFLRTDFGVGVLSYMHVRIDEFTSYADTGSEFVFGKQYKDFPFIFKVSTIIFAF